MLLSHSLPSDAFIKKAHEPQNDYFLHAYQQSAHKFEVKDMNDFFTVSETKVKTSWGLFSHAWWVLSSYRANYAWLVSRKMGNVSFVQVLWPSIDSQCSAVCTLLIGIEKWGVQSEQEDETCHFYCCCLSLLTFCVSLLWKTSLILDWLLAVKIPYRQDRDVTTTTFGG